MGERRSYGSYNDGCAAAHALDLIGDRWTMIVVRELLLGPKRFSDLQRDVVGIGPTLLTRRLRDLTEHGIAVRRPLGPGRAEAYELTPWGYGLESVNTALSLWAVASPGLPLDADMSPDTLVLAMRAHARPLPAGSAPRDVVLELIDSRVAPAHGAEPVTYVAHATPRATTIVRAPDGGTGGATVRATTRALKAVVIGGRPLDDVPGISVGGERGAVDDVVAATRLALPAGRSSP